MLGVKAKSSILEFFDALGAVFSILMMSGSWKTLSTSRALALVRPVS